MQKYIIYGRSTCPYCIKLIVKLAKSKKTFYVEMLDDNPKKLEHLKKLYNHPTVPIVILKNSTEELLGGCDDTLKYMERQNETSTV